MSGQKVSELVNANQAKGDYLLLGMQIIVGLYFIGYLRCLDYIAKNHVGEIVDNLYLILALQTLT